MSQATNKHRDQAEHLKRLFNELQQGEKRNKTTVISNEDDNEDIKIDVLNLPPRKVVHGKITGRARLRLGKPFLRFLTVIIILAVVMIVSYFIWPGEIVNLIENLK